MGKNLPDHTTIQQNNMQYNLGWIIGDSRALDVGRDPDVGREHKGLEHGPLGIGGASEPVAGGAATATRGSQHRHLKERRECQIMFERGVGIM